MFVDVLGIGVPLGISHTNIKCAWRLERCSADSWPILYDNELRKINELFELPVTG